MRRITSGDRPAARLLTAGRMRPAAKSAAGAPARPSGRGRAVPVSRHRRRCPPTAAPWPAAAPPAPTTPLEYPRSAARIRRPEGLAKDGHAAGRGAVGRCGRGAGGEAGALVLARTRTGTTYSAMAASGGAAAALGPAGVRAQLVADDGGGPLCPGAGVRVQICAALASRPRPWRKPARLQDSRESAR
jgi:hypothetical protein